jgi:ATP phosphoribosyltransferase regulatory subunit
VLAAARAHAWPAEVGAALDELEAALDASREVIDPALHARITVDLGEVRGFDYYTGLRIAGYARGAGDAVLRGGRYDALVGRYGRDAAAIGLAVDIEAIAAAQRAADVAPPAPSAGLVVGERDEAMRAAAILRARGVHAAVDLGGAGDRAAYARALGFTSVVEAREVLADPKRSP